MLGLFQLQSTGLISILQLNYAHLELGCFSWNGEPISTQCFHQSIPKELTA